MAPGLDEFDVIIRSCIVFSQSRADPEGVQWGCSNPAFGKNYFIFIGILV